MIKRDAQETKVVIRKWTVEATSGSPATIRPETPASYAQVDVPAGEFSPESLDELIQALQECRDQGEIEID